MTNKIGAENKPNRGRGRPKGAVNKTTAAAKAAIEYAADAVGGPERLAEWIKEDKDNEKAFWATIYPKLLPLQVNGSGQNGEVLVQVISGVPRDGD